VEVAKEEAPQKNASTPPSKAVIPPPFLGGFFLIYLVKRLAFDQSID